MTRPLKPAWLLAILAISIVPLIASAYPPIFDFANHLSRAYVMAHWERLPELHPFFEHGSLVLPNVLSDMTLAALCWLLPAQTAGKLFLVLLAVATTTGVVALNRAAFGRSNPLALSAALVTYNEIFIWGFLNYLLGLVILLFGLSFWMRSRSWTIWPRILVGSLFALALFFSHLVAFGLYAIAIAVIELLRAWDERRRPFAGLIAMLTASAAQFVLPTILFFAASPSSSIRSEPLFDLSLFAKVSPFTRLLSTGNELADALLLSFLVMLLAGLAIARRLAFHRDLLAVALVLVMVFVLLPYSALASFFLDARVPLAIVLIAISGVALRSMRFTAGLLAAILLAVGLRSAVLTQAWLRTDAEYAEAHAAFAHLPPGSVVFGVLPAPFEHASEWFQTRTQHPPHEHTASFATIAAHAFAPNIFAKPGQNPLVIRREAIDLLEFRMERPFFHFWSAEDLQHFAEAARTLRVPGEPPRYILFLRGNCAAWPQDIEVEPVWCGQYLALMRLLPADGAAAMRLGHREF